MARGRWWVCGAATLLVTALLAAVSPITAEAEDNPAPVYMASSSGLPGTYIVVADIDPGAAGADAVLAELVAEAESLGGTIKVEFTEALVGFSAELTGEAVDGLSQQPSVAFIEQDQMNDLPDPVNSVQAATNLWGLDRVDQRDLPLDNDYSPRSTGAGVDMYIIDTGISPDHVDFEGRVVGGANFTGGSQGDWDDCQGHGTHVAGTAGGASFGVASDVRLYAVRVLGCGGSGSTTNIIRGMEWVINQADGPSVANMSLGGSGSSIDAAADNMVDNGIALVVAAGNSTADACGFTPAGAEKPLTVAASDIEDRMASFSNFGSCVDIYGPGVSIMSASHTNPNGSRTLSGTSMASPHVAGAVANFWSVDPSASATEIMQAVVDAASADKIGSTRGSPNLLVYAVTGDGPPPTTTTTTTTTPPTTEPSTTTTEPSTTTTEPSTTTTEPSTTTTEPSTTTTEPSTTTTTPSTTSTTTTVPSEPPNAVAVSPGSSNVFGAPSLSAGVVTLEATADTPQGAEYNYEIFQYYFFVGWVKIYESGFLPNDVVNVDFGSDRRFLVAWRVTAQRNGEAGATSSPLYFSLS